jgi:hypothetical protein
MQPVQHCPPWHVPPGQGVVSVAFTREHPPFTHESLVHGLPSSQLWQAPPAVPHCVTDVPPPQVPSARQQLLPEQQPPPQHAPPEHGVPFGLGVPPQVPLELHVSLSMHTRLLQSWQKLPLPHWLKLGKTQLVPVQHFPAPQQMLLQQTCPPGHPAVSQPIAC